jgi:hypothetical protein
MAGRIKLRTFLLLLAIVVFAAGGALVVLPFIGCGLFAATIPDNPPPVVGEPTAAPVIPVVPATPEAVPQKSQLDGDVLSFVGKDIGTDKVKDAVKGRSYKINAYQDPGHHSVNRLKVDLNKNDKWDEKYTLEEGKITREVAPADDEGYTEKTFWNGSGWGPEGSAANDDSATAPTAVDPGLSSARDVDKAVLGYRGKNLGTDKLKDVTSGQAFKVNVYQDPGQSSANRAKVDLDRDDKWDEKFTFRSDGVEREVAPNDDEKYTEVWVWSDSGWKRK